MEVTKPCHFSNHVIYDPQIKEVETVARDQCCQDKRVTKGKILRLVPLDNKRKVKLSSRLKNTGVNESIALLFPSMCMYHILNLVKNIFFLIGLSNL